MKKEELEGQIEKANGDKEELQIEITMAMHGKEDTVILVAVDNII